MKKILFIFLLSQFVMIFGQTQNTETGEPEVFHEDQIREMPVFPGCENKAATDKERQKTCISENLNEKLRSKLKNFGSRMEQLGWTVALAKIRFVISTRGEVVNLTAVEGGNPELSKVALEAMEKIVKEIGPIKPAKLEDGTQVNLLFELPIKYAIQNQQSVDYKWDEIVRATLKGENKKYEIRESASRSNVFRIYEIQGRKETFIKEYKSIDQLMTEKEYQRLQIFNGKILMAERQVGKDTYRIYFSPDSNDRLEAYKLVNGEEVLFEKFHKDNLQYSKLYLTLILR